MCMACRCHFPLFRSTCSCLLLEWRKCCKVARCETKVTINNLNLYINMGNTSSGMTLVKQLALYTPRSKMMDSRRTWLPRVRHTMIGIPSSWSLRMLPIVSSTHMCFLRLDHLHASNGHRLPVCHLSQQTTPRHLPSPPRFTRKHPRWSKVLHRRFLRIFLRLLLLSAPLGHQRYL